MTELRRRGAPWAANRGRFALGISVVLMGSGITTLAPSAPAVAGTSPVKAGWAASGRMTDQRPEGATMTTLKDGRVMVIGGISATSADERPIPLATVEIYDPSTGTWSKGADMPEARSGHGAALLPSGKVLVAGGRIVNCCQQFYPPTAEIYDTTTNTWTPIAPMSSGRYFAATATLADGRILFAGGYSFDANSASNAETYSEATGTWSAASAMTHAGAQTATLMKDGKVFVLGGTSPGDSATSDIYDPATNSWQSGPGSFSARTTAIPYGGLTVSLLKDGRLLIVGQDGASNAAVTKFYDPTAKAYTQAPASLFVHAGHTATNLADGRVLVAGGYFNGPTRLSGEGAFGCEVAGAHLAR